MSSITPKELETLKELFSTTNSFELQNAIFYCILNADPEFAFKTSKHENVSIRRKAIIYIIGNDSAKAIHYVHDSNNGIRYEAVRFCQDKKILWDKLINDPVTSIRNIAGQKLNVNADHFYTLTHSKNENIRLGALQECPQLAKFFSNDTSEIIKTEAIKILKESEHPQLLSHKESCQVCSK